MNFWTQLTNSMVFITNIALDTSTVQMSFPAPPTASMRKSVKNNQTNNAHAI